MRQREERRVRDCLRGVREGLPEEVIFEPEPEGGEGELSGDLGGPYQAEGTASPKALSKEPA